MSKKKKFALILAGCGVYDGSEIHEATLSMYAISRHGCSYDIFAPDIEQHHVVDHLTGQETNEKRNVLVEAARVARGKIKPLDEFEPADYDVLLLPGGFGVAKNLSTFAFEGENCTVNTRVAHIIRQMHAGKKPIGALCISPVVVAKVLGKVKVTIGHDPVTIEKLDKMGAKHVDTGHGEVIVDEENLVVTTPCYMLDATIAQIGEGADKVVKALINL